MIGHADIGQKGNVVDLQGESKLSQESLFIPGIKKDSFALVSPTGHMITSAGILDS
jgi:hypothetical protein